MRYSPPATRSMKRLSDEGSACVSVESCNLISKPECSRKAGSPIHVRVSSARLEVGPHVMELLAKGQNVAKYYMRKKSIKR